MERRHHHEISDKHYYISWYAPRMNVISVADVVNDTPRHCEERSDAAVQSAQRPDPEKPSGLLHCVRNDTTDIPCPTDHQNIQRPITFHPAA